MTFDEWLAQMGSPWDQADRAGPEGSLVRRHKLTDTRWTVTDMSSGGSNYGMCLVHIPYAAPGAVGWLLLLHRGPGGWHWEARKGGYWVHLGHCTSEGEAMTAALNEVGK